MHRPFQRNATEAVQAAARDAWAQQPMTRLSPPGLLPASVGPSTSAGADVGGSSAPLWVHQELQPAASQLLASPVRRPSHTDGSWQPLPASWRPNLDPAQRPHQHSRQPQPLHRPEDPQSRPDLAAPPGMSSPAHLPVVSPTAGKHPGLHHPSQPQPQPRPQPPDPTQNGHRRARESDVNGDQNLTHKPKRCKAEGAEGKGCKPQVYVQQQRDGGMQPSCQSWQDARGVRLREDQGSFVFSVTETALKTSLIVPCRALSAWIKDGDSKPRRPVTVRLPDSREVRLCVLWIYNSSWNHARSRHCGQLVSAECHCAPLGNRGSCLMTRGSCLVGRKQSCTMAFGAAGVLCINSLRCGTLHGLRQKLPVKV